MGYSTNMTVLDDTVKGTTLGDPDGPIRFEESLDCEVPTFISPRLELIPNSGRGSKTSHKRLDYHVPFAYRGEFRPEQWPKNFRNKVGTSLRVTADGFVLCTAFSVRANGPCGNKAVNRSPFCRNHGGALHPADKKLSGQTLAPMPQDRIENLDRVQKFMQGFISVEELDDDEITGSFVRTSAGVPIKSAVLGKTFEQRLTKELHARLNRYLVSKTPRALEVLFEIIDSDLVEPADRLKAIAMLTDRTLGKAADVVITHSGEDKPYESIIARIEGGSREDYRKTVQATRLDASGNGIHPDSGSNPEILEVESFDDEEPDETEDFTLGPTAVERSNGVALGGFGATGEGVHAGWVGDDQSERVQSTEIDLSESGGDQKYEPSFLSAAQQKAKADKEARDRIKKARATRFAKRAVGGINHVGDVPYLLEYIVYTSGPKIGKYKMKMHHPSKVTPALLERVRRNNTRDLIDALGHPHQVESVRETEPQPGH